MHYKCLLIDNCSESFFKKELNIQNAPILTSEEKSESESSYIEIQHLFREIRQSTAKPPSLNIRSMWDLGKEKLEELEKLDPTRCEIYALHADFIRVKDGNNCDSNPIWSLPSCFL